MAKGGLNPKSLIKIQDALEILSMINRMRYNSYDDDIINKINNMSSLDRVSSLLKYLSKNGDKRSRENAKYMINLLHNIDSIKNDVSYLRNLKKENNEVHAAVKTTIDNKNLYKKETDFFNKIITFLNYLNGEE